MGGKALRHKHRSNTQQMTQEKSIAKCYNVALRSQENSFILINQKLQYEIAAMDTAQKNRDTPKGIATSA